MPSKPGELKRVSLAAEIAVELAHMVSHEVDYQDVVDTINQVLERFDAKDWLLSQGAVKFTESDGRKF